MEQLPLLPGALLLTGSATTLGSTDIEVSTLDRTEQEAWKIHPVSIICVLLGLILERTGGI